MERPTQLTPDESSLVTENHAPDQREVGGPQIPRVVIESTGQTRFASSVLRVLSMQRFYKKTGRRSRDSWLERYTGGYQEDRDWRRPLMRRSASNSPQVQSPTSEGTGSSRDASDARLDATSRWRCNFTLVFDPSGDAYFFWLSTVVLGILYNYWTIIFRVAFFVREQKYVIPFMAIDYSCDFIFLLDILVQFRTGYFLDGKIVTDTKQLAKRYVKSLGFFLDCVSILPVDLLFLLLGPRPALRFGRLLKAHRSFLFCDRVEIYSGRPKLFNLLKQIHYLFLIIHWVACFYFLLSYMEGFAADKWLHPELKGQWAERYLEGKRVSFFPVKLMVLSVVYFVVSKVGPQYLYSLFRSLVSMTTVGTGKTNAPQTTMSLMFCIFTYLCGVLIFATIVGNAADMIVDLRRHREKYHRKLDGMKEYIAANQLPMDLQRRVIQWFDFAWRYKKDMSEEELFQQLNDNFRAEIAIHVNLDTLKKVKMFEHCDPGFLRELVLKLKPMLCSPGDFVCRQDEIGREMYIVNQGELEVVDKSGAALAKLSAGRHFGEISILDMKGIGNRRTASVRSVGFSDLFRLSKAGLEDVLEYYPEEKEQLAKIARQTYEKQRRERLNHKTDNKESDKAQDSTLKGHDPRKWLVADKETLKRRLSLIEAKNEVKAMANKFRRENGTSVNAREIVAVMAQRARLERPDEEPRKVIKEFLAKSRGAKIQKRNTMSYESLLANREYSGESVRENCFKDASTAENCTTDQMKKSQRKFFSRPHSRTLDSKPASQMGKDIPLLAFKENSEHLNQKKELPRKNQATGPLSFALNSASEKSAKPPILRKGILKRSSADSENWRSSGSMETSFAGIESAKSDEENLTASEPSKEEDAKISKQKSKFKVPFSKDPKKDDVKILLATPESSEIVEDSPKLHRAASRIHTKEKSLFPEIKINDELDAIAPEKRCACQQQDGHRNEQPTANCSILECNSAGEVADASAATFPSIPLVTEPSNGKSVVME